MKKIYIKALSVAFVCNTVLSVSLPLTTYANSELNNQEIVDQNEKNTLDEDMSISISPETLEETKVENDGIVEDLNVEGEIADETEDSTSNPPTELKETTIDNEIELTEDNNVSSQLEGDIEIQMIDEPAINPANELEEELQSESNLEDEITEIESLERNSTVLSIVEENEQRALVSKDVTISTYIESRGWLAPVEHGEIAGATNQGLKLESFKIASTHPDLSIQYRSFSRNLDTWFSWTQDNKESNPINSSDQIEAIQLKLDGPLASDYDIYYRVHSKAFGWLGWAKNGEASGTRGYDYRIEAIEVKVVPLEEESPKQTDTAYIEKNIPTLTSSAHVQSFGWINTDNNKAIIGVTGQQKRLEALRLSLDTVNMQGGIEYRSLVLDDGWQEWKRDGQLSGTEGQEKRLEAIEIRLYGEIATHFDVTYQSHIESFGWLEPVITGMPSGTENISKRMEALQIDIVEKGSVKVNADDGYRQVPKIETSAHVQSFGWLQPKDTESVVGTIGQRKRIEAVRLSLDTGNMQGGIEYRSLVQDDEWQGWKRDGQLSGTEGQEKRLEAIEIRLYGEIAKYFDVSYQSHVESFGWLEPVVTGMPSGTQMLSKRMEALQIDIVEKGSMKVNADDGYRRAPKVETTAHVQSHGWLEPLDNGAIVGTIGQRKRLEALRLSLDSGNLQGGIEYRSLVQDDGWQGWKRDGQLSGTEGQEKRLEAIEIRLYGEVAKYYDVTYQSHVESYGWLGTVVTGMASGTQMLSKRMEALKIDIVEKGSLNVNPDDGFKRAPIVFIDSGHGGSDPGASYFGLEEAWLNLSTGNRVIKSLREKGFDVRASRETDVGLELKERAALANDIQPDVFFSIHYNAMGGNNIYARGIESFIYHRVASGFGQETNRDNFETEDPRIEKSLRLADLIHKNVINDTKFYDRGVKGNNFHVLRETTIPAALIELGFVDNRQDSEIIKKESYHQKAADAIVKGIVAFFGNWK